jgi:NAD(P)-dependent dehydrogenase (short-subunit alcohol dehydrogenase family)
MNLDLKTKRILITGASSGIGAKTAEVVAECGGIPILVGRDNSRLNQVAKCIESLGNSVGGCISSDISTESGIQAVIERIDAPLDGIVFSAGIAKHSPIQYATLEYLIETFTTNTFSPLLLLGGLVKARMLNVNASLVFLASISALTGRRGTFAYAGSKGALIGFEKALADELDKKKIRVNVVSPAIVNTNIWTKEQQGFLDEQSKSYPLGLPSVEAVASTITFLISNASSLINGQNLVIDSGCKDIK